MDGYSSPDCYVETGKASMDKVIVITGGSRGIGAATALLAAEQGYRICINYQSDEQAAQSVLEQVRALGAKPLPCVPMSASKTK
jgi:NAD(P)-dependent dehydrogenase (short-subunit alcohol dehydrogenase family)